MAEAIIELASYRLVASPQKNRYRRNFSRSVAKNNQGEIVLFDGVRIERYEASSIMKTYCSAVPTMEIKAANLH